MERRGAAKVGLCGGGEARHKKANSRNKTMMAFRFFLLDWRCGTAVSVSVCVLAERIARFVAVLGAGVAKLVNAEL